MYSWNNGIIHAYNRPSNNDIINFFESLSLLSPSSQHYYRHHPALKHSKGAREGADDAVDNSDSNNNNNYI